MEKINASEFEKEHLIKLLEDVANRLKKRNFELRTTRDKLRAIRMRYDKAKTTIEYQRERIIQLYGAGFRNGFQKSV